MSWRDERRLESQSELCSMELVNSEILYFSGLRRRVLQFNSEDRSTINLRYVDTRQTLCHYRKHRSTRLSATEI
jgi:hypothetical protein